METGLAQRTENTVMQALESLNDIQVNDFLSGKSPLNLSVRLGDHMMLIQLQLSTLTPSQQNSLKQKVASAAALKQQVNKSIINCDNKNVQQASCYNGETTSSNNDDEVASQDLRSPIKSLSSMVSTPLTTTVQNMNQQNNHSWVAPHLDPISANLTSCLCKRLNVDCNNNCNVQQSESRIDVPPPFHQSSPASNHSAVTAVAKSLPSREQNAEQQLLNTNIPALAEASRNLTQTLRKLSKRVFTNKTHMIEAATPSTSAALSSRNTNGSNLQITESSGAVIESMKHHGKGIYSGTFSGTLNPSLQDNHGRPRRDISTIIHILNDLLSASPQCATRNGAKILFQPTQTSAASNGKVVKVSLK